MISIVIPVKNEQEYLDKVIENLLNSAPPKSLDIIIVNDGSVSSDGKFKPIELNYPDTRVINYRQSLGVGHAFDRGIAQARYETIILMGSDVFPRKDFYYKVEEAVKSNPNTLGCAVCIGIKPDRLDLDDPRNNKRYGADLLFKVTVDDLPDNSPLKANKNYRSIFKGKWTSGKRSNSPYEIGCLMGAFYFTSKGYYNKLGGWDTQPGKRYCGHRTYGLLEPYISLKSWLVGGGCTLYPDIEAGHIFGRVDRKNRWKKGGRGMDAQWWNAIFMLETMILDSSYRQELYDFIYPDLCYNLAHRDISRNYETVFKIREENVLKFKNTLKIFEEKFGYVLI